MATNWVAAKFDKQGVIPESSPGLSVMANHDPVQLNARAGQPMRLVNTEYTNGLYCHAFSKVIVRLPAPGAEFTATVGVDNNADTSGGRGSVHFEVWVNGQQRFRSALLKEGMAGVPVKVELNGAREFTLQVDDGGDGIACDQSDWANAKVKLTDGREIGVASLGFVDVSRQYDNEPPFSFTYGGKPFSELLKNWKVERSSRELDSQRLEHTVVYTDPKTGLQVRCVAIQYRDFPTVEWTVYFKNTGLTNTPILSDILGLDTGLHRNLNDAEFMLHHQVGTWVAASDFMPRTTTLEPNQKADFAPRGGRPCGGVWPYFNLEWGAKNARQGMIVVVGWPGQWAASFARDGSTGLRVTAGQERTHLTLHPGEEIRTPLIVLQFWKGGDWLRSQNIWRRWMVAHNLPRLNGKPIPPTLTPCSSHQFTEMEHATQTNQELFIQRYLDEGFPIDAWWMDAGWYVSNGGWPQVGTWMVNSNRFPNGIRAISDYAHQRDVKTLLWFEPERVAQGTWLYEHHPEWLLSAGGNGNKLLNLGNSQARQWLTDYISQFLTEQGIDWYRQDYNIEPLPFWHEADAPDRQGITENHYVTGYLDYWDALRRRHPDLLIDSCASGGHRNDLESMRRAVPLLRDDYIFDPLSNQCQSYGLALWLPYTGTGTGPRQFSLYELRSNMAESHVTPCWDVRDKTLPYAKLRKVVKEWRDYADDYLGDFYPLTPYSLDTDVWMVWQFDRPDEGKGVVQAFRRRESIYASVQIKLRGLDSKATYELKNLDEPHSAIHISGVALSNQGVSITITKQPGSAVLTYHKIAHDK